MPLLTVWKGKGSTSLLKEPGKKSQLSLGLLIPSRFALFLWVKRVK